MTESLAISQKMTYASLPEYICGVAWPAEKIVSLPPSYVEAAQEVMPAQLAKAGARIAWLLNRALDGAPELPPPASIRPVAESAKAP
jgi:hypothetical protein